MQSKHHQYLKAMDIEIWEKRPTKLTMQTTINQNQTNNAEVCTITSNNADTNTNADVNTNTNNTNALDWNTLQQKVAHCTLCDLCKTRTNVVFGVGNKKAEIMLIGEAPGANEDLQGEPFVGKGGMLLNAMLQAISLARAEVYIANILKCRPPNNRDPAPQEVALCTPYLQQQIALIKPKVIVAVGRIAAQFLLNSTESMGRLRGKMYNYGEFNTPLFVIYHPAYLLRSPTEKKRAYDDLLQIKKFISSI